MGCDERNEPQALNFPQNLSSSKIGNKQVLGGAREIGQKYGNFVLSTYFAGTPPKPIFDLVELLTPPPKI